ncbi:GNAT family N-acetyltransferase [Flavobacterium sp.]|uniref:GNAT family N-acetyltransferase n=1 Tax=Flavobacterium sp. TaxID=239 RepID=UPI003752B76C
MNLPPYTTFPTLKDEKISLRDVTETDIEALVAISFYNAIKATSVKNAAEMQAKIDKDYVDGNSIHWCIIDKQTNKIVGTCGYYRGLDKAEGELGCILLPQYRGKGYMSCAMLLAIEFGLNTIGLKRILAITNQKNDKAIKLLERLNFIKKAALEDNEIEYELRTNNTAITT